MGCSNIAESIAPADDLRENNITPADFWITTMGFLKSDARHHTYADYLTWPDTQSGELINGVAYVREPPAPARAHQEIVGELYRQIANALEGTHCRAYVAPFDVRLPKSNEEDDHVDTIVQPDLLIVSALQKLDARGMRGAPDWVAEVLSPSTASHDQVIKLPVYERAGVREIWLIHPIDRTLSVYRLKKGSYGRPTIRALEGHTRLTAVAGVTVDWGRVIARLG